MRLRRELDQLLPHLAAEFSDDDRLARDADIYFPAGQIQALAREIDDGERHFGMLDQREQFAQLKIWIGRFRRLQAWAESDEGQAAGLTEEDHAQLREIFPRLVGISKQHMPGYIEAFSRSFETDWDVYIAEATEQLRQATDATRQAREQTAPGRRGPGPRARSSSARPARPPGRDLDELKAVIARHHLPDEGADEFLAVLEKVVKAFGQSDPQLLDLVRPYAELLTGSQFRALRRNLDRERAGAGPGAGCRRPARGAPGPARRHPRPAAPCSSAATSARTAGASSNRLFEFGDLEWIPYESARPAMLKSLEQRVRNHGMDLVLILKEFVGHNLSDSLRPLCEEHGIPCLYVDHGYGAAQVAEALRKGLSRLAARGRSPEDGEAGANGQAEQGAEAR